MEIDKRSNLEHFVEQAVTLATTTVHLTINRFLYQNYLKYISSSVSVPV